MKRTVDLVRDCPFVQQDRSEEADAVKGDLPPLTIEGPEEASPVF